MSRWRFDFWWSESGIESPIELAKSVVGLAMTSKDQASLHDVYQMLDGSETTQQTSYILHLWRDLTSSLNIVGPYFTCSGSLASKFILACVLETLQLFQMHGFKTSVLVYDGAASNLTTIKATMGIHGAFGMCSDLHKVEPWFINPFNPPKFTGLFVPAIITSKESM